MPASHQPSALDGNTVPTWAASYSPKSVDPVTWAAIREFVVSSVVDARPSGREVCRDWLTYTCQYVAWCRAQHHPVTRKVIWQPDLIDLWVETEKASCVPSTQGAVRSVLRKIGRRLEPTRWPHPPVSHNRRRLRPPYSDGEIAELLVAVGSLPTDTLRWKGFGVVAAGAGAGCDSQDFRHLRGSDIRRGDDGAVEVSIGGVRPRAAVCLDRYADLLLEAGERAGESYLSGGQLEERHSVVKHLVPYLRDRTQVRLEISRLRTSWLVSLFNARVPVNSILTAAGVHGSNIIEGVLPHLTPADATLTRDLMRSA